LISDDIINTRINDLVKTGLVKQDKKSLTEFGRTSLKVVLAGGVFDIIHPGHIHTLNAAKALGDILIVVVATDKTAQKMKKRIPLHNQKLRRELVDSLLMVDLCVVGNEEDIFKTVDLVRPEIIALGYDQVHQEKFIIDGCRKLNLDVKVARLQSPIPEFSSSKIEKEYGESIHGI
jgi:cytidyltransferase-like protein